MKKLVLCISIACLPNIHAVKPLQPMHKPTAIIFDIHGVLFEEDSVAFAKKIGLGAISSYTVSHWKNPVNTCLDTLEHMSKDTQHTTSTKFTFKDRQMPRCIVEWQCGKRCYQEVNTELCSYWNALDSKKYFRSTKEREITESVLRIALDPEAFTSFSKPIDATLRLAKELKARGYKLYLTGNMPKEPYDIMLKAHPEINQIFDGIHVSSGIGLVKPNSGVFTRIATINKLNSNDCLVIDDEKENIIAAEKIGMQGVLFTSAKQAQKILKKRGIL